MSPNIEDYTTGCNTAGNTQEQEGHLKAVTHTHTQCQEERTPVVFPLVTLVGGTMYTQTLKGKTPNTTETIPVPDLKDHPGLKEKMDGPR